MFLSGRMIKLGHWGYFFNSMSLFLHISKTVEINKTYIKLDLKVLSDMTSDYEVDN